MLSLPIDAICSVSAASESIGEKGEQHMTKCKRADLEELNRRHDEVYDELSRAIEQRDRAIALGMKTKLIASRKAKVSELEDELKAIEEWRAPFQREAEQRDR